LFAGLADLLFGDFPFAVFDRCVFEGARVKFVIVNPAHEGWRLRFVSVGRPIAARLIHERSNPRQFGSFAASLMFVIAKQWNTTIF